MKRREFIGRSSAALASLLLLGRCKPAGNAAGYTLRWMEDNSGSGHLIRDPHFPEPQKEIRTKVFIAGAGISGLSAARALQQQGLQDFLMAELQPRVGGNSIGGSNAVSEFPWAAHYLPLPNNTNTDLLQFLEEEKIITGYREGLPIYEETFLCNEPSERLYLHHHWQEGLVPSYGIEEQDRQEIRRFFKRIEEYAQERGSDGRYRFEIPLAMGSADSIEELDSISMKAYMQREGYRSTYLLWYVDYCCRDDYGAAMEHISAYVGLHYFTSRRGRAANAEHHSVLTWPEGNYFLVKKLAKYSAHKTLPNQLVYRIVPGEKEVISYIYDVTTKQSTRIVSEQVICCLPYNVARTIIDYPGFKESEKIRSWPWAVANIRLRAFEEDRGQDLCWDNVFYAPNSLGYVNACHQQIKQKVLNYNFTFYKNILAPTAEEARKKAQSLSKETLFAEMLQELKLAHPYIETYIDDVVIKVWGHGMVSAYPGFLSRKKPQLLRQAGNRLFLAHTDLSGISIFEEAFYQGREAAAQVLQTIQQSKG